MHAVIDAPQLTVPERERLFHEHGEAVAAKVVTVLGAKLPKHVRRDELKAAALVGVWQASRTFNPDRGVRFGPWAYRRAWGEAVDWLRTTGQSRRQRPNRLPVYLSSELPGGHLLVEVLVGQTDEDLRRNCDLPDLVAWARRGLTPLEQRVLDGRLAGKTLSAVAASEGYSESWIQQVVCDVLDYLRQRLKLLEQREDQ